MQLDQLASYARTALTDPLSLPEDEYAGPLESDLSNYAVGKLDEIINTINPAEITRENAAQALRVLGQHMNEITDRFHDLDDAPTAATFQVQEGLDHIDEAISLLDPEAS